MPTIDALTSDTAMYVYRLIGSVLRWALNLAAAAALACAAYVVNTLSAHEQQIIDVRYSSAAALAKHREETRDALHTLDNRLEQVQLKVGLPAEPPAWFTQRVDRLETSMERRLAELEREVRELNRRRN